MGAWFYARGGQQLGPIEFAQLQALAAQRELMPEDLVWTEGMPDWLPASRTPGLSFSVPSLSQAPSPQQAYQPPPARQPIQPPLQYVAQPQVYQPPSDQSSLALTGFILSLLGPFSCGAFGFGGVICGWAALNGMRRTGNHHRRGLALAAIWIGAIELFLMLIFLILFLIGISVATD